MAKVTKRVIYQRANWHLPTTISLQDALTAALKAVPQKDRSQPLSEAASEAEGTWRKMIRGVARNGCVFGKLVQYTHGMKQETVRTKVSGKTDEPPDGATGAPEGEEFSEGALYFCVDGDHVVVAQSLGLRIQQLESYLNWLLREQSGVVHTSNHLSLESLPPEEARKILAQATPKAITFTRPVQLGRKETVTASKRYSTDATLDALAELMGVRDLKEMLPQSALAEGRIKTSLTLYWNSHVGGQKPEAFLRGMGRLAFRQMDEDEEAEVEIEVGASKFSRKHLSMAESLSIEAIDGVIIFHTVYTAMLNFLAKLRRDGQIVD